MNQKQGRFIFMGYRGNIELWASTLANFQKFSMLYTSKNIVPLGMFL